MTEQPYYIRRSESGSYAPCSAKEAQGVALNGTPYHLFGRTAMDGLETVVLAETDAGRILLEQETAQEDADAMTVDHEYRLTLLELGGDGIMLYRTLKRLIEKGQTEGLTNKLGIFFAVGKLTEAEYTELTGLLTGGKES